MASNEHEYYLNKGLEWLIEKREDYQYVFDDHIKPDIIIKTKEGKLIFLESLTSIKMLPLKIGKYINNCDELIIVIPYKKNYDFWGVSPKVKILIVNNFNGEVLTSDEYMKLKEEKKSSRGEVLEAIK